MISPLLCFSGVIATFIISFFYFINYPNFYEDYFFLPILILIFYYTIINIIKDESHYQYRCFPKIIIKSFLKFIFWGVLISLVLLFYQYHPFYSKSFPNTIYFIESYFKYFLSLGFVYFLLVEKFRYSFKNNYTDPYIRFFSLLRNIVRKDLKTVKKRIFKGEYKRFWLSSLIRIHFIPVMVEQIFYSNQLILKNIQEQSINGMQLGTLLLIISTLCWSIDGNNASMGYFWESNFTKTRFRGVDSKLSHWLVTIICYFPFSAFASTFLLAVSSEINEGSMIFDNEVFVLGVKVVTTILLILYALCGTTLNFSFSNLSYKKIHTGGVYSIVRHPGTLFKVLYFFIIMITHKTVYQSFMIIPFIIWLGIYIMRTVVEEDYLSNFQEYRQYREKTKYRIFPGIF